MREDQERGENENNNSSSKWKRRSGMRGGGGGGRSSGSCKRLTNDASTTQGDRGVNEIRRASKRTQARVYAATTKREKRR